MSKLDGIVARAEAFESHGTPGRHAPEDRKVLLAALRAVEALHVVDEQGKCAECTVAPFSMHSVKYPCPTIRAIREALA